MMRKTFIKKKKLNNLLSSPRIRLPKNFYFTVEKHRHVCDDYCTRYGCEEFDEEAIATISLHDRNNEMASGIGEVRLVKVLNKEAYETHSSLDQEYWGKGLGTKLYAKAIQWGMKNGLKVRSSVAPSTYAQRVWNSKSLRKYFKIRSGRDYYGCWYVIGTNIKRKSNVK